VGWFVESSPGQEAMPTAHEPKAARIAAFRLLPAPLRSSAVKRPKGHGLEEVDLPGTEFRWSSSERK